MARNYKEFQIEYLPTKNPNIYVSQILYKYEISQFVNAYKEIVAKFNNLEETDIFKFYNPYEIYVICKIGTVKSPNPIFTNLKIGDYFINWSNPKNKFVERVENIIVEKNKIIQINSIPVKPKNPVEKIIATSDYNLKGIATINRTFLTKLTKELSLPKIVNILLDDNDNIKLKGETTKGVKTYNIQATLANDFSLF